MLTVLRSIIITTSNWAITSAKFFHCWPTTQDYHYIHQLQDPTNKCFLIISLNRHVSGADLPHRRPCPLPSQAALPHHCSQGTIPQLSFGCIDNRHPIKSIESQMMRWCRRDSDVSRWGSWSGDVAAASRSRTQKSRGSPSWKTSSLYHSSSQIGRPSSHWEILSQIPNSKFRER